jgi:hypothetical protein
VASRSAAIRLSGLATPFSGDVEGGAVIGRSADERQPERHIDRAVEIERLHRDQRLVVIHAQRGIVIPPRRGVEHRVGGEGAARIDAGSAQLGDRRSDDLDVLAAERAGFSGMRVEPGDREHRPGDTEIADQRSMSYPPGVDDGGAR